MIVTEILFSSTVHCEAAVLCWLVAKALQLTPRSGFHIEPVSRYRKYLLVPVLRNDKDDKESERLVAV